MKATWSNLREWWQFMSCPHDWKYAQDRRSRWCDKCTHVQLFSTPRP